MHFKVDRKKSDRGTISHAIDQCVSAFFTHGPHFKYIFVGAPLQSSGVATGGMGANVPTVCQNGAWNVFKIDEKNSWEGGSDKSSEK